MRSFIALQLDSLAKERLTRVQDQLRSYCVKGSFTPRENLHLTMKFLGDLQLDKLLDVQTLLNRLKNIPAPEMSFSKISTLRAASIVIAKLKADENLYTLESTLTQSLDKLGFTIEKGHYMPHITLLRRYQFEMPFSEVSKNLTLPNKPFTCDKLTLFESVFPDKGAPVYNEIFTVNLKKN